MSLNELFSEIENHLLNDDKPSKYLNKISFDSLFNEYPFNMLYKMKTTPQSPKHHPEGNVWKHTLLVVDQAAALKSKSKDERIFMWSALLHDIGKPRATKYRKGRITAYDHDKSGAPLARDFLMYFNCDTDFTEKVVSLVRWHMQILYVSKDLNFADISAMKKDTDVYEVALLGLCDRLGRTNVDKEKEFNNIDIFLNKVYK